MNQLLESYKILQVKAGAPIDEITASFKRLCDLYIIEVSGDTESAERMRDVNAAYCYLCDKLNHAVRLKKKLASNKAALQRVWRGEVNIPFGRGGRAREASFSVLRAYLKALMSSDTENAYSFLCDYDKQLITKDGFGKWRESAMKSFAIKEFSIEEKAAGATVSLKNGRSYPARKYRVTIAERNTATKETKSRREDKLIINENGRWYVFLGSKDLSAVARISDVLRGDLKPGAAPGRLEKLAETRYVELDMMNLKGLTGEIKREQYRQRRYGGAFTIGVFTVGSGAEDISDGILFAAASEIKKSLRATDIPAFLGGASFAVLFIGLKKKNAEQIIRRIADRISDGVESETGVKVNISCEARISLKHSEFDTAKETPHI